MPTLNEKRTFNCIAHHNGEVIRVTYDSEYISCFNMINTITSVIYKHVDISPLFTPIDSYPDLICTAVENDEYRQWQEIVHKEREKMETQRI